MVTTGMTGNSTPDGQIGVSETDVSSIPEDPSDESQEGPSQVRIYFEGQMVNKKFLLLIINNFSALTKSNKNIFMLLLGNRTIIIIIFRFLVSRLANHFSILPQKPCPSRRRKDVNISVTLFINDPIISGMFF